VWERGGREWKDERVHFNLKLFLMLKFILWFVVHLLKIRRCRIRRRGRVKTFESLIQS
jgi:hypothetical protein